MDWELYLESWRDISTGVGSWAKMIGRGLLVFALIFGVPALDLGGVTAAFGANLGLWGRVVWILSILVALAIGVQTTYARRKELRRTTDRARIAAGMTPEMRERIHELIDRAGNVLSLIRTGETEPSVLGEALSYMDERRQLLGRHQGTATAADLFHSDLERIVFRLQGLDKPDRRRLLASTRSDLQVRFDELKQVGEWTLRQIPPPELLKD